MLDTVQILLVRQFTQAQRADAVVYLPTGASSSQLDALRAVEGVAVAEPLAQLPVTLVHGSASYSTTLAAFPADTGMHRFLTGAGTRELPAHGILVGEALKDRIGLSPGDEVDIVLGALQRTVAARVAGFVDEPLGTFAYASTVELAQLIGAGAAADATQSANVQFAAGVDRSTLVDRLTSVAGVAAVIDARGLERAAESLMGLFYAFVGAMLVLGAVMAFALLFNLMSANIGERVTELASLHASGMSSAQLSRAITAENLVLTLAGIVPGLIIGYAGAAEFMASFSSDLFSFELHVRPTTFLFTALGVVAAALVSQLPILAAVRRIDIAQVVRERAG
jgi:putative ABC transport system permease protein